MKKINIFLLATLSLLIINCSNLLSTDSNNEDDATDFVGNYTQKYTLQVSLDLPTGPFAHDYNMGYGLNGCAEFFWFDKYPDLALVGSLTMATWNNKNNVSDNNQNNTTNSNYNSVSFKVGANYYFLNMHRYNVYGGLLLGYHFIKGASIAYQQSTSQDYGNDNAEAKFGISPVLGGSYHLDKGFDANLSFRYNQVIRGNYQPTHFSIYAGVSFYFE